MGLLTDYRENTGSVKGVRKGIDGVWGRCVGGGGVVNQQRVVQ